MGFGERMEGLEGAIRWGKRVRGGETDFAVLVVVAAFVGVEFVLPGIAFVAEFAFVVD